MKRFLPVPLYAYIIMCFVLYFYQRDLLYFPTEPMVIKNTKTISFENEGLKLRGHVLNEGKDKAIIYYGGNSENIEENAPFFRVVAPNHTVYLINYRGYGLSEGTPSEAGIFSDAQHIFDEIAKKHSSISLYGRSLGSGTASFMASQRDIEKLVLITPFDSVQNVAYGRYPIFPVGMLLKDKFESWKYAPKVKVPTLIIYSDIDTVVPAKYTNALIPNFNQKLLTIVKINEAYHNDIIHFKELKEAVEKFIN